MVQPFLVYDHKEVQEQLDGRCRTKWRQICRNSLMTICTVDLENISQGHRVRLLQWHILKSMKVVFTILTSAVAVSKILALEIFYLEIVGQVHGVQLLQWHSRVPKIKI